MHFRSWINPYNISLTSANDISNMYALNMLSQQIKLNKFTTWSTHICICKLSKNLNKYTHVFRFVHVFIIT